MKRDKKVPKVINVKDAVFGYFSVCCSALAEKPACTIDKGQIVGVYLGAKPTGESTLGKFRCSSCRKRCKVTRAKKESQVAPVLEGVL